MFLEELKKWKIELNKVAGLLAERLPVLQSALEWSEDRLRRINVRVDEIVRKFRERKARWALTVRADEVPNMIRQQLIRARAYVLSGITCLLVECAILFVILKEQFAQGGYSMPGATISAAAIALGATVITSGVFHGLVHTWGIRNLEPEEAERQMWRRLLIPSSVATLICAVGWVALQRLPVSTVLSLRPLLIGVLVMGLVAFVLFGSALLVLAWLLRWSKPYYEEYEALLTVRQTLLTFRRECIQEISNLLPGFTDPPPSPEHGGASAGAVLTIALLGLVFAATLTLTSCDTTPAFSYEPEQTGLELMIESDASGIVNRRDFETAGHNLQSALPNIVETARPTVVKVFWFGSSGWSAELKAETELPPFMEPKMDQPKADEIRAIRPDVAGKELENDRESIATERTKKAGEYNEQVRLKLGQLSDILLPPETTSSPCTDLQGNLDRHRTLSETHNMLILSISDGGQNCHRVSGMTNSGKPVRIPIVIILVPPTQEDGFKDFTLRKQMYESVYQCAEVVAFYDQHIEEAVKRAMQKCR